MDAYVFENPHPLSFGLNAISVEWSLSFPCSATASAVSLDVVSTALVAASTLFAEEDEAEAEAADDDDAEEFFAKVRTGCRDRVTRRTNEQRARSIAVDVLKSRWRVQLLIRIIHEMQSIYLGSILITFSLIIASKNIFLCPMSMIITKAFLNNYFFLDRSLLVFFSFQYDLFPDS